MRVLGRDEVLRRVLGEPPLLRGWWNLEAQAQPHGFDLRVEEVERFRGPGRLGREGRDLPPTEPVPFDPDGWVWLAPGAYRITFAETVHLPADLMALAWPRSSLLRMGATVLNAVWDAGYEGRSRALLVVHNLHGLWLERGARVVQMVFLALDAPVPHPYRGAYQGER